MKAYIPLITSLLLAISSVSPLRADILHPDIRIRITGKIYQEPFNGQPALCVPLNAANVLSVLNIAGIDPKTQQVYWDETAGAYVLASKGLQDGADVMPTAIILQFDFKSSVGWQSGPNKEIYCGAITMLNGLLTGTDWGFDNTPKKVRTNHENFYAFGTIAGRKTIIKGAYLDVFKW